VKQVKDNFHRLMFDPFILLLFSTASYFVSQGSISLEIGLYKLLDMRIAMTYSHFTSVNLFLN